MLDIWFYYFIGVFIFEGIVNLIYYVVKNELVLMF